MAKKELALEISVDSKEALQSVTDLRKQFAEVEDALFNMAGAGKKNTEEFKKAQLQAASLKQEIDNINTSLDTLKPAAMAAAFTNVTTGLASGFAGAQGAMALFGAEGEDLQRTLVKVQSAMAIAEGVRGLSGLREGFSVLGTVIRANPILMIATVIAGIGTALFALKDKIGIVGDAFDAIGDAISWVTDKVKEFTDWIGISTFALDEQRDAIIKNNEDIKKSVESRYNDEISAAKRAGDATEGLEIQKLSAITQANDAIIRTLKAKGEQRTEDEQKTLNDLEAANRAYYQDILDLADASADRERARREKEYQDYLAHIAKYGRGGEAGQIIQANQVSIQEQTIENELRTIEIVDVAKEEAARKDLEREQRTQEAKRVLQENAFEMSRQFLLATQAVADLVFDHQLKQAQGNANAERKIRKKQFQVNKAFGIANSVIDGVQAVQKALNNPYPLNIILAAASGIMATANTIRIAKTEFNDGGGGSTGGGISGNLGAAGGGASIAPPSNNSTLLNADGTIKKQTGNGQPMVKAYVTETDISSTQKRVNSIEEKSKIK